MTREEATYELLLDACGYYDFENAGERFVGYSLTVDSETAITEIAYRGAKLYSTREECVDEEVLATMRESK